MIDTKQPGRGSDQFPLRLPSGMRDSLKLAADEAGRSMNAEIIHRLVEWPRIVNRMELLSSVVDATEEKDERRRAQIDALEADLAEAKRELDQWADDEVKLKVLLASGEGLIKKLEAESETLTKSLQETTETLRLTTSVLEEERKAHAKTAANAEVFHNSMVHIAGQRDDLTGRLEATEAELREAKRAHDEALNRANLLDDMFMMMSDMANKLTGSQKADLDAIEKVEDFLGSDALHLELTAAETEEPKFVLRGPGSLQAFVARNLAAAIDRRMAALARIVASLFERNPNTARIRMRALLVAHAVGTDDLEREIAFTAIDEEATDASEFYEFVAALASDAPDDERGAYLIALRDVMPRLFPRWSRA